MGCGASKGDRHDARNSPEERRDVPPAAGDPVASEDAPPAASVPRIVIRGHQLSQPCRSVQWYCRYAGLDVSIQYVDLGEGEHMMPAFLERHPAGQVPALEEGDFNLAESTAILQYLSCDDASMALETPHERARLNWYFAYHVSTVRQLTKACFELFLFAPPGGDDVSSGYEQIKPILQQFDAMLATQDYVLGPRLSLADFMFAPEIDDLAPLDLLAPYPHLVRYLERIAAVKGYPETHAGMADAVKELKEIKNWKPLDLAATPAADA
eukprot:TRINITY_DN1772_c0_g1_i1.p1 TRINITY_DN1772_c0_g1~~TRINITY_DN1772_c0_g1_i1.p1  ORF type:complete len:268 (+),score=72.60 TRINITY_DN1772_c0_g1_i1:106-909(+)